MEVSHETGPVFRGTGTEFDIWRNSSFSMMCDVIYLNIRPGEDLVKEPFHGLITKWALLGYRLKQGTSPSKVWHCAASAEPVAIRVGA
jgi:hypothetical protein